MHFCELATQGVESALTASQKTGGKEMGEEKNGETTSEKKLQLERICGKKIQSFCLRKGQANLDQLN